MFYYRLYILDNSSRIGGAHEFHAADDEEACARAHQTCGDLPWELWRGDKHIGCPKEIKPRPARLADEPEILPWEPSALQLSEMIRPDFSLQFFESED